MSNERELVLALVDAPLPGPLFDDFWSAYPYKRGSRAAAERAWLGALKVAKPSLIVEGARRLAADPNLPPKAEERFVRHGSTWLRDRGWEDGPLPARNGSPAPPIDTDRDAADGEWALVDGEWVAR